MNGSSSFFFSSVGAKIVMAVTGFLLAVFVLGHMAGNLQVFAGPEKLNNYAHMLQSLGGLLWVARALLLVTLVLHVWSSTRLTLMNRAARPVPYVNKGNVQTTIASRNMYITGAMILFFLAYHLAQFTFGVTNPDIMLKDPMGQPNVYGMVVAGFSNPIISGLYIIAMVLLGLHLSHGVSSMFQSIGINRPGYNRFVNAIGPVVAGLIVLGNISMPIAALAGLVTI